ncbi:hypothetical protein LTSEMON_4702, partial [Salmonella enterica subsp. enterica serovar Montevideo str. S5-403]
NIPAHRAKFFNKTHFYSPYAADVISLTNAKAFSIYGFCLAK